MPEVLSVLGMLVLLVLVLLLAYYTTKWIGKKHMAQGNDSRNIEILERVVLGPDRQLVIVRAAGKLLLLGVTPQHIERIEELAPEDILPGEPKQSTAFSVTLKNVLKNQWGIGAGNEKNRPHE